MTNLNSISGTTSNTWTSTATTAGGCPGHNGAYCICGSLSHIYGNYIQCMSCNQYYYSTTLHNCSINIYTGTTTIPSTFGTNGTWTSTTWLGNNSYKEVKEITTDSDLTYEWTGINANLTLPAKFSDCFLKVGSSWVSLYPLIFSAYENDSKELSFHIVTAISGKEFEGDKVVLRSVITMKIEDNLSLIQLAERTKEYFKDAKTSISL